MTTNGVFKYEEISKAIDASRLDLDVTFEVLDGKVITHIERVVKEALRKTIPKKPDIGAIEWV